MQFSGLVATLIENHNATQVFGFIGIEAHFDSGVKTQELRGNNEQSKTHQLGTVFFELEQQVAGASN